MIEGYGGTDLGKDEETYKSFDNIINYEIESEIDENDDDEKDMVYVVYDGNEKLIMNQNKKAILEVFENEEEAENHRKDLEEEDEDNEIEIQEIKINDYWGAIPDDGSDDEEDDDSNDDKQEAD